MRYIFVSTVDRESWLNAGEGRMSDVSTPNPSAVEPSADVRAAIAAVDAAFMEAFNRGDAGGAAREVYTRDAQIQPPGAPMIEGRENIAAFWAAAQQQIGIRSATLSTIRLRQAGSYVHQLGAVTLTLNGGAEAHGKFAVLWKSEDGQLKWDVDTWNMDA